MSLFGISKLQVENSFINYFDKDTEIYKGMKLIDEELLILLRELEETSKRELCERLATCCDNVQTKIKRKLLIFLTKRTENIKDIKTSKTL